MAQQRKLEWVTRRLTPDSFRYQRISRRTAGCSSLAVQSSLPSTPLHLLRPPRLEALLQRNS
jgi:hypothetical protein